MKNQWGFTDDPKELERIIEFRDAAVRDGWAIQRTYPNHEPIESAASLEKDGFKMMILSRPTELHKFDANIHIWGPDRLAIKIPDGYSWESIKDGLGVCGFCGKTKVETRGVAFANRVCEECYPEAKKKLEYPGWCD